MVRPRRKYSKIPAAPTGKIGCIRVIVWRNGSKVIVSSATRLPPEIEAAARMWLETGKYADMDLTEYLNRMFDAVNYQEGNI